MQFSFQIMYSASPSLRSPANPTTPDERILRALAIVALSGFCLLLYFSGSAGRRLNRFLAGLKIIFMIILIVGGIVKAIKTGLQNFNEDRNTKPSSHAAAFLLILFSFEGWENATFVAGEIPKYGVLRRGFIAGITLVSFLYFAVNLLFVSEPFFSLMYT
jgi:amino acid transporter